MIKIALIWTILELIWTILVSFSFTVSYQIYRLKAIIRIALIEGQKMNYGLPFQTIRAISRYPQEPANFKKRK